MANEKNGLASDSVDVLTDEAQKQFERFVQGAHQMTACALAAIDACSADVPQTVQLMELLVRHGFLEFLAQILVSNVAPELKGSRLVQ